MCKCNGEYTVKTLSDNKSGDGSNKKMNWDEIEKVMNKKSSHEWETKEVQDINVTKPSLTVGTLQEELAKENFYFQQLEQKEAMEEKMKKIEKLSVKVVTCKEVCHYYYHVCTMLCISHPLPPSLSAVIQQNTPVNGVKKKDTISHTRELKKDSLHVPHVTHVP